jgi:NADH-ubiquinone oxidoreductase chain 4
LLIIPILGIFLISTTYSFYPKEEKRDIHQSQKMSLYFPAEDDVLNIDNKKEYFFDVSYYKKIAFVTTILNVIISLIIYILFDFSNNQFQFIQENLDLSFYDIYLGVDGLSIYFVLLTTIIMPIALVSN